MISTSSIPLVLPPQSLRPITCYSFPLHLRLSTKFRLIFSVYIVALRALFCKYSLEFISVLTELCFITYFNTATSSLLHFIQLIVILVSPRASCHHATVTASRLVYAAPFPPSTLPGFIYHQLLWFSSLTFSFVPTSFTLWCPLTPAVSLLLARLPLSLSFSPPFHLLSTSLYAVLSHDFSDS